MITQNPTSATIPENSSATDIGIGAPADTQFATTDLVVKVSGLPANGTVVLADGTTPVTLGQSLTVAQLVALKFQPALAGLGSTSDFAFAVSDPDGASVNGAASLTVGAASPAITTSRAELDVQQESVATPIGIAAPGDAGVPVAALAVDITGLPSNGTLYLSDGTTAVTKGESLTVAELTSLTFAPATDGPGESSLDYTVSDPAGNTGAGSAALTVGAPSPLVAVAASLTVPADSGAVPIGIGTPADVDFDPASLSVTVTSLPTDGKVVLPDGATPVSNGQSLTVAQLTALEFAPTPGVSPQSSSLKYSVSDPSGTVATGAATLNIGAITPMPAGLAPAATPSFAPSFAASAPVANALAAPAAGPNAIVLENEKPGTPESIWGVDPGADSTKLEGFTTAMSTDVGGVVSFKIDNTTGSANYSVSIYRLGYYGGDGATLVTTLQHTGSSPVVQPNPITNAATGEVDAGNWSVTDSWQVPTTATSGVYIADVTQGKQVFQIPFVIRSDASTSDIVFQTSDETWQAYNGWGGANLYGGDGPSDPPDNVGGEAVPGAAFAVSYNRPIVTRDSVGQYAGPQDSLFGAESSSVYWLEENGYDVSYISGLDTSSNGSLLLNHKVFVDDGHDEYWTASQVANVAAAEKAGVNMAFLSGNEMFWQTQFTPSIDGSNTAGRTLVTYKDSHFESLINPSGQGTGAFEAPVSWGGLNTPSNGVTGELFSVDETPTLGTITIPYGETQLRLWRNTSVANTAPGGTASLESGLLGYEWDSSPDNGFEPANLIDLSTTTLSEPTVNAQFGNVDQTDTATHNLVEFRDPTSGALIFGAGTVFWSWGLSSEHDPGPDGNQTNTDPNVQQAMVNLFADMGIQPGTLQASLKAATKSTDATAPSSKITGVSTSNVVEGGAVTVSGTATDVGGVVAGVEVSVDGGNTWHPASSQYGASSINWTYAFKAPAPGNYAIQSRAVDDSLNAEKPGAGTPYTVTPSPALSLFPTNPVPAVANVPDLPVEVGMRFTSSTSGTITGIRFYKGAANTGTHIADLWGSSGQLLASATFTGETASGWQQVNFTTPVKIQAGQTYVASYHTNGQYADTAGFFDTYSGQVNGSLTGTGDAANGVYSYGSTPTFPTTVPFDGDNYWVDVVYNDQSGLPQANNDSGFTVAENTTLTIPAATLLANDTDPNGLSLSVTGVSNPLNGTVSYNASTQTVSFIPTTGYAGPANFTYTIADTKGATGSGNVALTVTYPNTQQSLFGTTQTPGTASVNDPHAVELGMKFAANENGAITGIRFYKGPTNTGTHVADLWSSTGQLLASATFTAETASGWQEVNFASPVQITAGTTYVAAYHTSSGNYADDSNFFNAAYTNQNLTAPATGTSGGNGVYTYGSTDLFPTQTYQGGNYWVDVVFDGAHVAGPVANPDNGFVDNLNTALTIAASTLLANDTDPAGLALSITGVGSPIHGTVTYDATQKTVTYVPATGYTGTASFTYTVTDTAGNSATGSVGLTVEDPKSQSLFSPTSAPVVADDSDKSPVELGVKFVASQNGMITGIRFYKGPTNTGTHIADLWSSTGQLLASASFTAETASGWQQVNFATPVSITAGTTYIAAYHTNGFYAADPNYFANTLTSGMLTAPASSSSGGNGVYAYGSTDQFPTQSYQASNYWVDVLYSSSTGLPPVANDDSGLVATENTAVTIAASKLLANDTDPNGLPVSIASVGGATHGTVSYNAANQTVTFTPATGYAGSAIFTYSATDADGGQASATASLMINDPAKNSLFDPATAPSELNANDKSPVELGMKFVANTSGQITGIRFYKAAQNSGPHTADLWSASGTLLATATFSNETPSGWQEADFATPVSITAGTTYIAAYHTTSGYSDDVNYFASAHTSGPLTAPASGSSGGNGVYAYGSTDTFPTSSYNASSYAVDVLFKATLAA